ncbi:Protocatechuate 3,4-dioxygenase, alpha subunit [Sulfitobacter noctilucicola]|uniref:Protocatechuate 3,4-dioxygenase alpha subunit n=1 Tax=Sulfitobacter noctilucicola TaxID=1342301 RepID=A0A7W6Q4L0_9RHOB|nr:protocatechuate 3,4-dioxygenase subunit alpha [Sulfitobacter noctilucicola]KIN64061.1 Protocatechuate 3,4-dioxygenase, alpha subunit [Sulfitobacter noctilucicola]MBB4175415.1 protocatechuate 3,4-dioxygenase alpha subunit [Sulfitobacter noctilucicola]
MVQHLDTLIETPSQTAGPYVHIGCIPSFAGVEGIYSQDLGTTPIAEGAKGESITITGSVFDGTGWAMRDAMMESWQADAAGRYPGQPDADPNVSGFCRFAADKDSGEFVLHTIKPGAVQDRNGAIMAPHITLWIVARGINIGLHTRIYFEDEDNSADPLLARIEQRPRVDTLLARKTGEGQYRFDIRLRGDDETVFLDM